MIVAEWKPIPEIIEKLRSYQSVLIAGCATCVAECAAGGEREVETLAPLLRLAFNQENKDIKVITKTVERQCEREFIEELNYSVEQVDAVLSLACGIGIQCLAERFTDVTIYPGVNTTSLAVREEPGLWTARCNACGDCRLDETFGLCPIARCAKNLLNGPCGGTREGGGCEIDVDTKCIWNMIYQRASDLNQVESLLPIRATKDWSNSDHGGPKRMVREDLQI